MPVQARGQVPKDVGIAMYQVPCMFHGYIIYSRVIPKMEYGFIKYGVHNHIILIRLAMGCHKTIIASYTVNI